MAKKVTVSAKYLDFANVFLEKLANILSEQTGANEHAIKPEQGKQPPFGPIYRLGLVDLETFKRNIKINIASGFIKASKLQAVVLILFVCKHNVSFVCVSNIKDLITSQSKINIRYL